MIEVKLKATSEDATESEIVYLQFSNSEVETLKLYLKNCNRLEEATIISGEFPSVKNINWTADEGLKIEITNFKYSQVCELLHLARPIFLFKEPASFLNTQAIFGKKSKGTALSKHLKSLRILYEKGDYQPYFQITIGDTPLFHNETIMLWLNGVEYHQDSEKEAIIKELESSLSEKSTQGLFVAQLSGRIRATFMLAHLAKLVTDKG